MYSISDKISQVLLRDIGKSMELLTLSVTSFSIHIVYIYIYFILFVLHFLFIADVGLRTHRV